MMLLTREKKPSFVIETFSYASELARIHQKIVLGTYTKLGYIDTHDYPDGVLHDAYDNEHAHYYLFRAPEEDRTLGTFRIVRPRVIHGLPLHDAYPELLSYSETHSCEPTRVVSTEHYQTYATKDPMQHMLFEVFIQTVAYAKKHQIPTVVSLGTRLTLRWINREFDNVQKKLSEPRFYKGGEVIPCIVHIDEFENRTRLKKPEIWDYYNRILSTS